MKTEKLLYLLAAGLCLTTALIFTACSTPCPPWDEIKPDEQLLKSVQEGDVDATRQHLARLHGIQCQGELINYVEVAAENGHADVIELLISQEPTQERKEEAADAALRRATGLDNEKLVRLYLARKIGNPSNVLHMAACHGNIRIAKLLLDAGADIPSDLDEALANAAYGAHVEMVRFLLRRGADVNATLCEEPILCCALCPHPLGRPDVPFWKKRKDIVGLLLKHGADPNRHYYDMLDGMDYGTVLHCLCGMPRDWTPSAEHVQIGKMLLKAGVDINARNGKGSTALMVAVTGGNIPLVKLLLQAGADVHARNKKGVTALMLAHAMADFSPEAREIQDLLRAAGATDCGKKKLEFEDIDV